MGPVNEGLGACPEFIVICPATEFFRKGEKGSEGMTRGEFDAEVGEPWPLPTLNNVACPGDDNKPSPESWSPEGLVS
jgi:hypothetical protein